MPRIPHRIKMCGKDRADDVDVSASLDNASPVLVELSSEARRLSIDVIYSCRSDPKGASR